MKALTHLKSVFDQSSFVGITALILLVPFIFPHLAFADSIQTSGTPAQVFEINVTDPSLLDQSPKSNTQNSIGLNDVLQADPLAASLQQYLQDHQSPLAPDADKLITYPHWERALAISLVESHMCEYTPKIKTKNGWVESYNCSGVGGDNYRIYDSYLGWFKDMNDLLSQSNYINRPIEKFIGYYVVPGSSNWLFGVKKTEKDLLALEQQAIAQRQQMAQSAIAMSNDQKAIITFSTVN